MILEPGRVGHPFRIVAGADVVKFCLVRPGRAAKFSTGWPLSFPPQMSHKPRFGAEACLLTLLDDIPAVANLTRAAPKKPANSGD